MRLIAMLTSLGIAATLTTSAAAGPLHALGRDLDTSYHRNKCWPVPFVYMDNAAARAPFSQMIGNGWRIQTLVSSHHFGNDMQLNEAGREQIRWIVTQAPPRRRAVHIEQGKTPEETASRIDVARDYVERFMTDGEIVSVRPTHIQARGWPAQYVHEIAVKFSESTPEPRLTGGGGGFSAEQ